MNTAVNYTFCIWIFNKTRRIENIYIEKKVHDTHRERRTRIHSIFNIIYIVKYIQFEAVTKLWMTAQLLNTFVEHFWEI